MKLTFTLVACLALLLVLCARLALREQQEMVATLPPDAPPPPQATLLPLASTAPCPVCGGSGILVGRLTGEKRLCWRCGGKGILFPGIEQRETEPLDRTR